MFATSGGSGFEHSLADLKESVAKDTEIIEGKLLNDRQTTDGLQKWLETIL